jgi:hypothetical protein
LWKIKSALTNKCVVIGISIHAKCMGYINGSEQAVEGTSPQEIQPLNVMLPVYCAYKDWRPLPGLCFGRRGATELPTRPPDHAACDIFVWGWTTFDVATGENQQHLLEQTSRFLAVLALGYVTKSIELLSIASCRSVWKLLWPSDEIWRMVLHGFQNGPFV